MPYSSPPPSFVFSVSYAGSGIYSRQGRLSVAQPARKARLKFAKKNTPFTRRCRSERGCRMLCATSRIQFWQTIHCRRGGGFWHCSSRAVPAVACTPLAPARPHRGHRTTRGSVVLTLTPVQHTPVQPFRCLLCFLLTCTLFRRPCCLTPPLAYPVYPCPACVLVGDLASQAYQASQASCGCPAIPRGLAFLPRS